MATVPDSVLLSFRVRWVTIGFYLTILSLNEPLSCVVPSSSRKRTLCTFLYNFMPSHLLWTQCVSVGSYMQPVSNLIAEFRAWLPLLFAIRSSSLSYPSRFERASFLLGLLLLNLYNRYPTIRCNTTTKLTNLRLLIPYTSEFCLSDCRSCWRGLFLSSSRWKEIYGSTTLFFELVLGNQGGQHGSEIMQNMSARLANTALAGIWNSILANFWTWTSDWIGTK